MPPLVRSCAMACAFAAAAAAQFGCASSADRSTESAPTPVVVRPIDSAGEFFRWQLYYFRNPEPERAPSAIRFLADAGAYDDRPNPSSVGFYGRLFADEPQRLAAWMDKLMPDLAELPRQTIYAALKVAGTEAAHAELARRHAAAAPGPEKELLAVLIASPAYDALADEAAPIDLLMGAYLASGDDRYVRKAIDALDRDGFALWVLSSNAARYPEFLAVCREELDRRPPDAVERLAVVIARAEREPLDQERLVREAVAMFESRARTRFR